MKKYGPWLGLLDSIIHRWGHRQTNPYSSEVVVNSSPGTMKTTKTLMAFRSIKVYRKWKSSTGQCDTNKKMKITTRIVFNVLAISPRTTLNLLKSFMMHFIAR